MPTVTSSSFCECCCECHAEEMRVTYDSTYSPCNNPDAGGTICLNQKLGCDNWILISGSFEAEIYYVTGDSSVFPADGFPYTGYVFEVRCGGFTYRWKVATSSAGALGVCPSTTTSNGPLYSSDGPPPTEAEPAATGINPDAC